MQWRQGLESRPKEGTETEGPISEYSFIPAIDQPPWITSDGMLVGTQAPGDVWGIKVWGTWGPVSLIQSDYVPPGYSALITTYGPNSPYNPIGFRQHFNSDYHGLRHLPGEGPFPLVSSFHQRSFGVGVRHRGACVAIQVATSSTYTAPTDAQIPV